MTVFQAYKSASFTPTGFSALNLLATLPSGTGPTPLVATGAEYEIDDPGHLTRLDFLSVSSVPFKYFSADLAYGPTEGVVGSLEVDTGTGGALTPAYTLGGMSVGFVSAFEDYVADDILAD